MIINNNSVEQINVALLDLEKKLSTIKDNKSVIDSLRDSINTIKASLNETKAGLTSGATYDINITGNATTATTATTAGSAVSAESAERASKDSNGNSITDTYATITTVDGKADKVNLHEINDAAGKGKYIVIDLPASHSVSGKTTRLFISDDTLSIGLQIWNGSTLEKDFRAELVNNNHIYIAPKTLTPVSANVNFTNSDSNCYYTVINGKCYVTIWSMNITSNLNTEILFNNLPRAKATVNFILSNFLGSKTVGMGWISSGGQTITCTAVLESGIASGYVAFSYPIDETWNPS